MTVNRKLFSVESRRHIGVKHYRAYRSEKELVLFNAAERESIKRYKIFLIKNGWIEKLYAKYLFAVTEISLINYSLVIPRPVC